MTEVCSLCYDPITGLPNYTQNNQVVCQICLSELQANPEFAPVDMQNTNSSKDLPLAQVLNYFLNNICQNINILLTNQSTYLSTAVARINTINNWQKLMYPTSVNLYQKNLTDKLDSIAIQQDDIHRNQKIFGRVCGQIVTDNLTDLTSKLNQLYRLETFSQTLGPLDNNYFLSVLPSGKFQRLDFDAYQTQARTFSTTYDNKLFYYDGTNLFYKHRKNGEIETVQVDKPREYEDYQVLDVNTNGIWYQRNIGFGYQRGNDIICMDLNHTILLNIPRGRVITQVMFNDNYIITSIEPRATYILRKNINGTLSPLRRLLVGENFLLTDNYLFYLIHDEDKFSLYSHNLETGQDQNLFDSEIFKNVYFNDKDLADYNLADGLVHYTINSDTPIYGVYDFTGQKLIETHLTRAMFANKFEYDPEVEVDVTRITINPNTGKVYLFEGEINLKL